MCVFNDPSTPEICPVCHTLSLHGTLPISVLRANFVVLTVFALVILVASAFILPETNRWKSRDATRLGHLVGNYRGLLRHRSYVGYVLVVACTYSGIFSFISGSSFVLKIGRAHV